MDRGDRQRLQQVERTLLHRRLVEEERGSGDSRREDLLTEEQVRDHVQVVAEREVLVDGGDAEGGGVLRA